MFVDIAILGGGPAGATAGALLRKYRPDLSVAIFERETFPRDHVGESLLPHLMPVLQEMEVWDLVEAHGFPIKVGGIYRWGSTDELWPLDFIPGAKLEPAPRPGKYEGQRKLTAFQVDRSAYDKILLDHAEALGCKVYQNAKALTPVCEGDRVLGIDIQGLGHVEARHTIDATGGVGLLRRHMGVEIESPTSLRNIAIWDYWQNADWSEQIGIGGTRILVLSIEWGWLWFIAIGSTRTSVGLVTPAEYFKSTGKRPRELYDLAIRSEPRLAKLLQNATCENDLKSTKDWSFIAQRLCGENWFLAGDSAGFADPILSAGLTLAQAGARKVAYSILELERGDQDPAWIRESYDTSQKAHIRNHIRFADYWYSSNGRFTELKEYCSAIASDSGLKLDPESAFLWLGQGGFASDKLGEPLAGTFRIGAVKYNIRWLSGTAPAWEFEQFNSFQLDLSGAEEETVANYAHGQIEPVRCYRRGSAILPRFEAFGAMIQALSQESELPALIERFTFEARRSGFRAELKTYIQIAAETLEAMVAEGWVRGSTVPNVRFLKFELADPGPGYHVSWRDPETDPRPVKGNKQGLKEFSQ